MTLTCLKCGEVLDAHFAGKAAFGHCPHCNAEINFPETAVEYKIVTQKMLTEDRGFDKKRTFAEGYLNSLALEGWRIVGCTTQAVENWDLAGFYPSAVIILAAELERPRCSPTYIV